jgi:hypothetical protein
MANTRNPDTGRSARRGRSSGSLPWVSELQLDAYLEAREALRRAHAASLAKSVAPPARTRSRSS